MYNFSKTYGEKFDALDITLMRTILKAPKSTPKEAFYLELGIIPPSVLIKVRRMNYLHYLLRKQRSEMISMFLGPSSLLIKRRLGYSRLKRFNAILRILQ